MSQETADSCLQTCNISPLVGCSPSVKGSQSKKKIFLPLECLGPEDGSRTILRNMNNHLPSGERHIADKWNTQQRRGAQFDPSVSNKCDRRRPLNLPVTVVWRKHENFDN